MYPTNRYARSFQRRVQSARMRIEALSSLRSMVSLPPEHDISARQWLAIENQLHTMQARLQSRLKRAASAHFPRIHAPGVARSLNGLLGEIELEMTSAFTFFDTYVDVLTQRSSPQLGPLLAGCDVLARYALRRDHPALSIVEPPLVYCDRGFGASILREGVLFPDRTPNVLPLVQIPYSRLKEKWNLTSVLHEVGHEAIIRLGLKRAIPAVLRANLKNAGAADSIAEFFALWSSEIAPDFWAFCASGVAQTGIREILALPPGQVFRVSWTDPHPPPYVRVLLSFEWCRQVWGRGMWDYWEAEWLEMYPLETARPNVRNLLAKAQSYLPTVARALIQTRFAQLNGKTLRDLFDLAALAPTELSRRAATLKTGRLNLRGLSPCSQLAVFRVIREQSKFSDKAIDRIMTAWLAGLACRKDNLQ